MRSARPPNAVDRPLRTDECPWSAHHERAEEKGDVLGWYDGCYVLPQAGRGHDVVADDPAMGQYGPSFTGAIEPYLRDELGVDTGEEYRLIEFARIGTNWDYGDGPGRPPQRNYAQDFAVTMRRNASFELFVGVGLVDLATTFGAVEYALSHAQFDRARLHVRHYARAICPTSVPNPVRDWQQTCDHSSPIRLIVLRPAADPGDSRRRPRTLRARRW